MTDRVDAAIAAAEAPGPIEVELRQFPVVISSTGRPAVLAVPPDLSESELLELMGWMAVYVRGELARARQPLAGRLIVPTLRAG